MQLEIGQTVDGYRLDSILGEGGMGIVYRATDVALDRSVALKFIKSSLTDDDRFAARFRSEARLLAQVDSPNIVGVHAFRQTEYGDFIVMEYVEGQDLSDILKEGPISVDRTINIVRQTLMALDRAHGAGVVHRDIKPQNVMVTESDSVKVTDFGLAKLSAPGMMSTMTQGIVGTLYYMSPEQVRGEPADFRSDLWAVGVLLYEMLMGERPFDFAYEAAVLYSIMNDAVEIPESLLKKIPEGLDKVILKVLEKNADDRYQTAAEMLEGIDACVEATSAPSAKATGMVAPSSEKMSAKKIGGFVKGAILLTAALLGIWTVLSGKFGGSSPEGTAEILPVATFLTLETEPSGASVRVEGSDSGQTPLQNFQTASGEESVRASIELDGYIPIDTTLSTGIIHLITMTALRGATVSGEPTSVSGDSGEQQQTQRPAGEAPALATLILEVFPEGTVSVDGGTESAARTVSIESGEYTIACQSPTYQNIDRVLSIEAGATITSTCYFEAEVTVAHTPGSPWGNIWINDINQGRQTPSVLSLGPGNYVVSVRKFGYDVVLQGQSTGSIIVSPSFDRQEKRTLIFELTKQQ